MASKDKRATGAVFSLGHRAGNQISRRNYQAGEQLYNKAVRVIACSSEAIPFIAIETLHVTIAAAYAQVLNFAGARWKLHQGVEMLTKFPQSKANRARLVGLIKQSWQAEQASKLRKLSKKSGKTQSAPQQKRQVLYFLKKLEAYQEECRSITVGFLDEALNTETILPELDVDHDPERRAIISRYSGAKPKI